MAVYQPATEVPECPLSQLAMCRGWPSSDHVPRVDRHHVLRSKTSFDPVEHTPRLVAGNASGEGVWEQGGGGKAALAIRLLAEEAAVGVQLVATLVGDLGELADRSIQCSDIRHIPDHEIERPREAR